MRLVQVLADHGLACRVTSPTHDRGGLLDVVATRDDLPAPAVDVLNVDLFDHQLLRWSAPLNRPSPPYTKMTSPPWRQLDQDAFLAAVVLSALCCPDRWRECNSIDNPAQLYDDEITAILKRLIPVRTVTCRRRSSDPWFDQDCRVTKRSVRALERTYR